jgi:hypothetical protein
MAKKDTACASGHVGSRCREIVCLVEVRIVDANKPEIGTSAFNAGGLIQQDTQTMLLQMGDFFDEVVVPQYPEAWLVAGRKNLRHHLHGWVLVLPRSVPVVPGDDEGVVGAITNSTCDCGSEFRIYVYMQIAELKESEAFEGLGEPFQFPMHFDLAYFKDISMSPGPKKAKPQSPFSEFIDRDIAF